MFKTATIISGIIILIAGWAWFSPWMMFVGLAIATLSPIYGGLVQSYHEEVTERCSRSVVCGRGISCELRGYGKFHVLGCPCHPFNPTHYLAQGLPSALEQARITNTKALYVAGHINQRQLEDRIHLALRGWPLHGDYAKP